MKTKLLLLLLFLCTLSACYNEVDVEAPWQDIPIVWGALSRQDTAHYIRVEKAFLPDDTNAFEVAQIADSLYHEQITVLLEKTETGESYSLQKVDGNLEGYPREEGTFATEPNYLYKIKAEDINLSTGENILLKVIKQEDSEPITAETTILGDMELVSGLRGDTISFTRLIWQPGEGGELFALRLFIHIEEKIGTEWVSKTLDWPVINNLKKLSPNRVEHDFQDLAFFNFLLNELDDTQNVLRRFKHIDVLISAGGQEFLNIRTYNLSNFYLTGAESLPFYTNLSSGRGLFTSKSRIKIENLKLSASTSNYLRNSNLTDVLNFQ